MECGLTGTRSRGRLWLTCAASVTAAVILTVPVVSQGPRRSSGHIRLLDGRRAADGEVLVKYRPDANPSIESQVEATLDTDDREPVGGARVHRLHSRSLSPDTLVAILRQDPRVEYVEPNYIVTIEAADQPAIAAVPNDSLYGSLYGLPLIGAPSAWNYTTGSRVNVVTVVDTGIQYTHPDLSANVWSAPASFTVTIAGRSLTCGAGTHGFNAIAFSTQTGNACDPADDHGHGTHVSGTIGAVGNNGAGVAGVNWTASIMGAKFLDSNGSGSTSDAINAIEFAIQAKAAFASTGGANVRVLSNSWGGSGFSQALLDEINRANASEMLFVAAAGNSGVNLDVSPSYPASYSAPNLVTVAATDSSDVRASFSNYSSTAVHLAAPGVNIQSTYLSSSYGQLSGTSMATPHVSGAAALLLSACSLSTAQLRSRLLASVDPVAGLVGYVSSGGRLNVATAMQGCPTPSISLSASTATAGSSIGVSLNNGPGNATDWVGLYAAGAGDGAYLSWLFMNGAHVAPTTPIVNSSVQFTAPATAGTYEVRWFSSNTFNRIGTSSAITVSAAIPAISLITPTVGGGGAIRFSVSGGPANTTDWVGLYASGDADGAYRNWLFLNGARVAPANGLTSATLQLPAPATSGTYEVRWFSSNSFNRLATSTAITVRVPTVTGPGSPVAAGGTVSFSVADGPGNPTDWVALAPAGAPDTMYSNWLYLNGAHAAPTSGLTSANLQFTAPTIGGSYEIRLYASNSYTRLAASGAFTVQGAPAAITLSTSSVGPGSPFTFTIDNGPGNATDWVALAPTAAADGTYLNWQFMNGARVAPASGLASATLQFLAPASPGTYEVRLFANNTYTRVAASSALTVAPPSISLGASTVSTGGTVSVTVSNGPGNPTDWIAIYQTGAADGAYGTWLYLNGAHVAPASGIGNATLVFTAPMMTGTYEFRLFSSNTFNRLATSGTLTVQ